ILILSHDVIGTRMAGTGIRYWEMAHALAATQPVVLLAPQPPDLTGLALPPMLTCGHYTWGDVGSLAPYLAAATVVVANGMLLLPFPTLAQISQPLALDLYDPIALENLELFRHAAPEQRIQQAEQDRLLLQQQLATGDFLMCATERQRDLYMGALLAGGQITPTLTDADPTLRHVLDVVPFGVAATPPTQHRHALRGTHPAIPTDAVIVLWTGGLWDWLDPLTLIRAMPSVLAACPQVRLVFLAGAHPGTVQPMQMPQRAEQLAAELGLLDQQVIFYREWIPYAERADALLDADIAVSLHHNHLETTYAAVRSRFLDHLWAGLPSVVSEGDAAAALVQTHKLGYTVAANDGAGVAHALIRLAEDAAPRAEYARNAQQLGAQLTWTPVLGPLRHFCQHPTKRPRAGLGQWLPAAQPPLEQEQRMSSEPTTPALPPLDELIRRAEQLWQFGSPADTGGRISRIARYTFARLLAPVIAQQRDFNATSVQLFYALRQQQEQLQQQREELHAVLAQVLTIQDDLHRRMDSFERESQQWLDQITGELHHRIDTVAAYTGESHAYLDSRIDILAQAEGSLHDRVTRLTYTLQLLDDALAAADEAHATLAVQFAHQQHPALSAPRPAQITTNATLDPNNRRRAAAVPPTAAPEPEPPAPTPRPRRKRGDA
ncbi:MAG: glycosyltransferase family 4 protein, partial [Chloroflexaceae bacterium]|nr:glycosyltransferase family 4 protein [Chloroflexaceae bacterium]